MPYETPGLDNLPLVQPGSVYANPPAGMSCGHEPRDFTQDPFCSNAEPFSLPMIPRSEWDDRIKEADEQKSTLDELMLATPDMHVLDQNGTNYCWINAPTFCMMTMRIVAGLPGVRLSPASVGAPIKNYRNNGGWGTEGLKYIINHGVCSQATWPANAIDRKYDNAESQADRKLYKCQEWWELPDRSFDALASAILARFPVAIGLNWWSHEVTGMRLVKKNGLYLVKIANSWSTSWGEKGYGLLSERDATPDDACVARVVSPTGMAA